MIPPATHDPTPDDLDAFGPLESLGADLRRLYGPSAMDLPDPGAMDRTVMTRATRRLGARRSRTVPTTVRWRRIGAGGLAVAAVLTIAGTLVFRLGPLRSMRGPMPARGPATLAAGPADIDGSGRIDMLDAFLLARRLRAGSAGGALLASWDLTGDGIIDGADVDAVAMRAVRLTPPAPGGAG